MAVDAETAAVPEALAQFSDEPIVLVQSGQFPHAGYDRRFRLLTRETLMDSRNAPGCGTDPSDGHADRARVLRACAAHVT
jgi:hypothetical protein